MNASGTIFLTVAALAYTIVATIIFIKKEKIKKIENTIFTILLFISIFSMITELSIIFTQDMGWIGVFNQKLLLMFIILWLSRFMDYTFIITMFKKEKSEIENINKYRKLYYLFWIINIISMLAIFLSPIEFVNLETSKYTRGISVNIVYGITTIYMCIIFILVILNIKNIKQKRYLPIIALLILLTLTAIIQNTNPQILLTNAVFGLVIFIMYQTIENPDVKMLEEIEKNRELTEKSIEDKANMLFKITEDVKTPISKIEILSNKIIRNDELEEIHTDAKSINSLSRSVNNTINNVMGITNYDIANLKVSDISYDMYNLFKELVIMTKEKLNDNIEFSYHMSSTIPNKLYGDSLKIKQIIYTIIMNAIKHTKEGSIDLNIESINRGDVCRLIIEVSDTGVGMDAYKINEILETDSNLKEEEINKIKDLDVDLKIAKKMIDMLGGSLLIKSEEGEGSTFTIIINQGIVENTFKKKTTNILSNKKKCLVICDDVEELEKLSLEMKKNNYLVFTSLYGMDLVKEINNNYDLIFIDDEMKPHNAVEVMKEIGKTKEKIVIMLNKDKESIKEHYLNDYPFTDYLLKDNYKEEIKRIKDKY